ncbi:MAG: GAF domain-containing protein [bacterium]|nr:GAF domain-containing protein [bacterium]
MVVRSDKKRNVGYEGKISPLHRFSVSLRKVLESALHNSRGHVSQPDCARNAFASAILECSDPDEILTRALHQIVQSAGMDAGAVYLKNEGDEYLSLACQEGFASEVAGELASIATGEGLIGNVYARGEVAAGKLDSFPSANAEKWLNLGFRSFVGLPICSSDRILGVLMLLGRRRRSFSRFALDRLRTAGSLLGGALEKARTQREIEDALVAARRLSRLPQEPDRTVSPNGSLEELAQAACEATLSLSSMVVLVDAEGRVVRRASFGYSRKAVLAAARTDAVSARCLESRESVAISTPAEIREAMGDDVLEAGFASCICLPLRVGEQPLGTLWLNYESPRSFSALEIEQLRGLADRVAGAIENSHRQALTLRRLTRHTELTGHIERIASRGTLRDTLQALSDGARELLAAKTAIAAFSRDERSEQAVSVARQAEKGREAAASRLREPEIAAIAERAHRLISPVESAPSELAGKNVHRMRGLLARRLLDEEMGNIGLLIVADRMEDGDFSEDDAELLDALGRHGSVAIQNAVKAEESRAVAEQYRALLDHAPIAIATLDKRQTLTAVNRAFEELSGFTKEELQGRIALFDLLPEMERKETLGATLGPPDDSAVVRETEAVLLTKTGEEKRVRVSIGGVHDSGSVTICLTDLSQSVRPATEEKPETSPVSAMTSSVLSALKQPLVQATEQLQSLLHQKPPDSVKESLETTYEKMRACRAALEGLAVLAEPQAMSQEPVNLNDLVTSVVDEKAQALPRDGIGVALRLDASLPVIEADATQLRWALTGLLENSCQMLRDVQRDQRLTIQTERVGQSGRLSIRMTPAAVPPEELNTLFDAPSGDDEDLLTKLKFAPCGRVIERHGWRLHAEQTSAEGLAFLVEFPLPAEASDAESQTAPAAIETPPEETAVAVGEKRILVVDDERVVVDLLDYYLRSEGHSVDISRDGRAALRKLKESDYDLILCDIKMPEVTGQELYHWIEANKPHLADRVIFITGDVATPETLAFLHNPPKRWLEKPFDLTELRRTIAETLARSKT